MGATAFDLSAIKTDAAAYAGTFRTLIGVGTAGTRADAYFALASHTQAISTITDLQSTLDGKQPLDSDLTAIAALTTTSFGRGLLTSADAAALRSSAGLGVLATRTSEFIQVALSANGSSIASGTKKGMAQIPYACNATSFKIICDPANEPSAASVEVDCNKLNLSTGAATSILSAVASISTGANAGTGTINGTQSFSAGDVVSFDVDQGSDGKELIAILEITPT